MTIHSIPGSAPSASEVAPGLRGGATLAADPAAAVTLTSSSARATASSASTSAPASPSDAAARRQAADAVTQAFRGSPEALMALVSMRLRQTTEAQHGAEARTSSQEQQAALRDQERQVEAATAAAAKALSDARSGDFWGTLAKVVTVVVSIVATVCTAGAAAPAAAGALLIAFGDDIAKSLVDAGVLTPEQAKGFATAIKLVGAALMAPETGGLSLVSGGLQALASEIGPLLQRAGVSSDVVTGITVGLSVAGSVVGIAAGAAGGSQVASNVQRTVETTGELANGAAKLVQGGFQIDGTCAMHTHDVDEADAQGSRGRAESAESESGTIVDEFRSEMKQVARLIKIALQAADARSQASHAAAGGRA